MASPWMAGPGTAELQLGISPCRKADASVAGSFTFRMAPFSVERRRKGIDVVDAELELGVPRNGPWFDCVPCTISTLIGNKSYS
jgi:hypothetical protein